MRYNITKTSEQGSQDKDYSIVFKLYYNSGRRVEQKTKTP